MNYHNITHDDMLNGDGLRVVLWVSGCSHECKGCHNPQTHDINSGLLFDINAEQELFEQLDKDYISGITFSGGDPLHENNLETVYTLINKIKGIYGDTKTIWLYSGYTLGQIFPICNTDNLKPNEFYLRQDIIKKCDVFVDGRFIEELRDEKYHWAGSTNQNIYKKGIDF